MKSDLWIPLALGAVSILGLLGLHWAMLRWQAARLTASLKAKTIAATDPATETPIDLDQLVPLQSFTAPQHQVRVEDLPLLPEDLSPDFQHKTLDPHQFSDAFDPSLTELNPAPLKQPAILGPVAQESFLPDRAVSNALSQHASDDEPFSIDLSPDSESDLEPKDAPFAPTLQEPAANAPEPIHTLDLTQLPHAHDTVHYQKRLVWDDPAQLPLLAKALKDRPWTHVLPVTLCVDSDQALSLAIPPSRSVRLAWQVLSRKYLADAADVAQFEAWCETIAVAMGGWVEPITQLGGEQFIDRAHSEVMALDSVITLRVSVPAAQMDLFAQSLLAARFVQHQEHWVYEEQSANSNKDSAIHATGIVLERLWKGVSSSSQAAAQHSSADASATNNSVVFQLVIDIPQLDSLAARKVYMRLRGVARVSAAILQSAQGAHLPDATLDKYGQFMIARQEALSLAGFEPAGELAQRLYSPRIRTVSDLEA